MAASGKVITFRMDKAFEPLLKKLARDLDLSMGELVKRIAYLGLHGMDFEFYPLISELSELSCVGFGEACRLAHVHVVDSQPKPREKGTGNEDLLHLVVQLVQQYRNMRGIEKKAESRVVQVRIVRSGN